MLTADSNKKFVLCITNAFTKYAVVTAIANKEAETVVDAILKDWFTKFGIPAQIHTDGGKEFVNKLSAELFQLLNVRHTKTSPAHPQCEFAGYSHLERKVVVLFLQNGVVAITTAKLQRQKDSICYRSTSIHHRTRTKIQKQF